MFTYCKYTNVPSKAGRTKSRVTRLPFGQALHLLPAPRVLDASLVIFAVIMPREYSSEEKPQPAPENNRREYEDPCLRRDISSHEYEKLVENREIRDNMGQFLSSNQYFLMKVRMSPETARKMDFEIKKFIKYFPSRLEVVSMCGFEVHMKLKYEFYHTINKDEYNDLMSQYISLKSELRDLYVEQSCMTRYDWNLVKSKISHNLQITMQDYIVEIMRSPMDRISDLLLYIV
jgi:hypothetical protein